MANQEHLNILKQGAEVWNKWRKENPAIEPDLSNIDLEREAPTALSYIDFGQFNDDDLDFDFLAFCNLTLSDYVSKFSGCALGLSEVDFHGVNFNSSSMGYLRLVDINFRNANLKDAELTEAFLYRVDLAEAILSGANLDKSVIYETSLIESIINKAKLNRMFIWNSDLRYTDLSVSRLENACFLQDNLNNAMLSETDLRESIFYSVDLSKVDFSESDVRGAKFYFAVLEGADLTGTKLVQTTWYESKLYNCKVYGTSAWNVELENTEQLSLIITDPDEAVITVDSLEVAPFIHLLLKNQKIREVINTITSKVVLILGRFTDERKSVLAACRREADACFSSFA
jgi:uncharacterized protein YjbI with pentapeptide repeats